MPAAGRSSLLVREELPLQQGRANPGSHCLGEAKLQEGLEGGRVCFLIWYSDQETFPMCLLNRDCPTRIKDRLLRLGLGPLETGEEPALWGRELNHQCHLDQERLT